MQTVSKLKFLRLTNSKYCCFGVKMAFLTKIIIYIFLVKMICLDFLSLNLKTKLSSELHDKSFELFKQP